MATFTSELQATWGDCATMFSMQKLKTYPMQCKKIMSHHFNLQIISWKVKDYMLKINTRMRTVGEKKDKNYSNRKMDEARPSFSAQLWSSTTPEFASKTGWKNMYHCIDQNAYNKGAGKLPQERPLFVPLSAAGRKRQGPKSRYNHIFAYLSILNHFAILFTIKCQLVLINIMYCKK